MEGARRGGGRDAAGAHGVRCAGQGVTVRIRAPLALSGGCPAGGTALASRASPFVGPRGRSHGGHLFLSGACLPPLPALGRVTAVPAFMLPPPPTFLFSPWKERVGRGVPALGRARVRPRALPSPAEILGPPGLGLCGAGGGCSGGGRRGPRGRGAQRTGSASPGRDRAACPPVPRGRPCDICRSVCSASWAPGGDRPRRRARTEEPRRGRGAGHLAAPHALRARRARGLGSRQRRRASPHRRVNRN